jgi:hypothetical protein
MYKAIALIGALILGGANCYAQTQKGDFLLGAGTSLDLSSFNSQVTTGSYESDKVKSNSFELKSRLGYFLVDNFVTGIDFITSYATIKEDEDGDVYKSYTFAIGPFARYYFGQTNVKPFIDASFGFGKNNSEYDSSNVHYSDDKVKSKLSAFDAGGGISFVLTPKVTFEVGISYGNAISKYKTHYNEDAKNKVTGVGSNVGFSIHL